MNDTNKVAGMRDEIARLSVEIADQDATIAALRRNDPDNVPHVDLRHLRDRLDMLRAKVERMTSLTTG